MATWRQGLAAFVAAALQAGAAGAATLAPDPVLSSDLVLRAERIGAVTPRLSRPNLASPVPVRGDLYVVDQGGAIHRSDGAGGSVPVLEAADAPAGLDLHAREGVLNIAAGPAAGEVVVAFTSHSLPDPALPVRRLPDPLPGACCADLYRAGSDSTGYQVLYRFDSGPGGLTDPRPFAAFEVQLSPGRGAHRGGGMLGLPDGRVLFATGDNLPFGLDGRGPAQDTAEHVSKLIVVDPLTGASEIVAKGVRNVQRLAWADEARERIAFADIGGVTAEEVNVVALADLLDGTEVENFGWGRNPDGKAREGTFHIGPGQGITGGEPAATGVAPVPEAGFLQPVAQWGRSDPDAFVAISGPVTSALSFDRITSLFGDLPSGDLMATLAPLTGVANPVYSVALEDAAGAPVSLFDLAGGRPDPRFFTLPDGGAGVLLERTGALYRLTETAPIPLAPTAPLILSALACLALRRRTGRT
jgi:hypothetical protein